MPWKGAVGYGCEWVWMAYGSSSYVYTYCNLAWSSLGSFYMLGRMCPNTEGGITNLEDFDSIMRPSEV